MQAIVSVGASLHQQRSSEISNELARLRPSDKGISNSAAELLAQVQEPEENQERVRQSIGQPGTFLADEAPSEAAELGAVRSEADSAASVVEATTDAEATTDVEAALNELDHIIDDDVDQRVNNH